MSSEKKKSFVVYGDWAQHLELPQTVSLASNFESPPELPEELIGGLLRAGHKMLVSGSSKAGKSFFLMELCVSIAEGREWMGFPCKQGKVLYVNLEIDPASCIWRFKNIYNAYGIEPLHPDNIEIWNLRGYAIPMDKLVPKLIKRIKGRGFAAVVIDPIYKVITGDENNATDMGAFCNQFDKICTETGCSAIYCHHHSKGAQGAKRAMDRASGSGVFARDPDAHVDIIQLDTPEDLRKSLPDKSVTAWRMEFSLREFKNPQPVDFWFEYPLHRLDDEGVLSSLGAWGSPQSNLLKSSKFTTDGERRDAINSAYEFCKKHPPVTVTDMAEFLDVSERCTRDRLKNMEDEYWTKHGVVGKISDYYD
ncbi:MAG: AAA family ATPase [Clostridiales bacterium]|nr:AAA family ATPase [Clostridiales bacterium]